MSYHTGIFRRGGGADGGSYMSRTTRGSGLFSFSLDFLKYHTSVMEMAYVRFEALGLAERAYLSRGTGGAGAAGRCGGLILLFLVLAITRFLARLFSDHRITRRVFGGRVLEGGANIGVSEL
ncbi:hypothetical protein BDZ91DRAFT_710492 [Kalaharituber pfeilii]|nr:hypothetical protein BDZ91DRAFT_710492 [Kalaharituber pfeilii]